MTTTQQAALEATNRLQSYLNDCLPYGRQITECIEILIDLKIAEYNERTTQQKDD